MTVATATTNDPTDVVSTTTTATTNNTNNGSAIVPPTEMIYYTYEGNFQLECNAEILSCQFIDDEESSSKKQTEEPAKEKVVHIALNKTVMHAQGGGQPTDIGTIQVNESKVVKVDKVLLDRATGVATHMGKLVVVENDDPSTASSTTSMPLVGESVRVIVDGENRKILSECHTAGHVVDMAMAKVDKIMPATKAYHFLDGPYVEYKGSIPPEERTAFVDKLQKAFEELVEADIETEIMNVSRTEASEICNRVAENYFNLNDQFKEDETVRIVRVANWPCPCGGTHVKSTGLLKERNWGVTGLKSKKGVVRVKYGQDWNGSLKK